MKKIIVILLAVISVLTILILSKDDTDTNQIESELITTTTQPIILPSGYSLEKIISENNGTLGEFLTYADEYFVFQSTWFVRYKEQGKEDVIYSLTCGDNGSSEYINKLLENNKSAVGEVCETIPETALYFESSFCDKTEETQNCISSDGYIYVSYRGTTSRFYIGTEESNKFIDELIIKSLLWTPENPVTCG